MSEPISSSSGGLSEDSSSTSALGRLLQLCWKEPRSCILVLLSQVALLFLGLVGLGFTGLGIDYLRSILQTNAPAVHWPLGIIPPAAWSPTQVLFAIAGIIVIASVIRGYLTWISGVWLADLVHYKVVSGLQKSVFAKLQHLSFRFFDLQSRGAIINRATGDIQAIRTFVDTVLIQSLTTFLSVVVYASYMFSIHVGLSIACLATIPVMWIASIRFSKKVHPEYVQNRELFDRMIRTLAEYIEGIGVIKGFAREKEMGERFRKDNVALKDQQRLIIRHVSLFTPSLDMLTQISLIVLLFYGGWLVIHGKLPLGTGLVVFAGLLQQFSNQVGMIAQISNGFQESLTGAGRVFSILDAPLGLTPPPSPALLPEGKGSVIFENISFGYTPNREVLHRVNFSVQPGECVAIVGETGSGKSALLNLIPRFYDPTSGRILIDGIDAKKIDLQALRKTVGFVFQESFLFSDTVAANIAFGDPDIAFDKIVAAAKIACAHDFIEALPEGYETVLGESGVDLSGGQRQRLAIARAILTDPKILLLDDPTAAIDPETEHEILAAIDQAVSGRTTFIVAHRLSTLRRADRIFVLERGRIVQTGTHAELVHHEGPYRSAAMHQMIDKESRRLLAQEISEDEIEIPELTSVIEVDFTPSLPEKVLS